MTERQQISAGKLNVKNKKNCLQKGNEYCKQLQVLNGCVAQRYEHYVDIVGVTSSILVTPTN